jgi:hypothetical protein
MIHLTAPGRISRIPARRPGDPDLIFPVPLSDRRADKR